MALQEIADFSGMDLITLNRLEKMVGNAADVSRSRFRRDVSLATDPRRDYDEECGYPKLDQIQPRDYWNMYKRNPLGRRVVQLMPRECWQTQPTVTDTQDAAKNSKFNKRFLDICQNIRGRSWHTGIEGSKFWEVVFRADELSGIGRYGGILVGLRDGSKLSQPAPMLKQEGLNDTNRPELSHLTGTEREYDVQFPPTASLPILSAGKQVDMMFLQAFDQTTLEIISIDGDETSPRFQQPLMYRVQLMDPRNLITGIGAKYSTTYVHWTRIVHLADNIDTCDIAGAPRQEVVWDRLIDSIKMYGGSAEMYWLAALMGISFETHPQLGGDVVFETDKMRQQMWNFQNRLQRYLFSSGMSAKSLAPQVSSPAAQIAAIIENICIVLGCPKRVFMGSERGELASSQDDAAWNSRVAHRQNFYLSPNVIAPLIDRLIMLGVLPEPDSYSITWPELDSLTDKDRAAIGLTRMQTMQAFMLGGVSQIMCEKDMYVHELNYTEEVAEGLIKNAAKEQAKRDAEQADQQQDPNDPNDPNADPNAEDPNANTDDEQVSNSGDMWDSE